MKKALTYTIIAGNMDCTNKCPICISRMTPNQGIGYEKPSVDWETFEKATQIATNHGAENVLITGKGEPTLFPDQITQYLMLLRGKPFDKRELQTNGYLLANGGKYYDNKIDEWKYFGLDFVAVSIYHYDDAKNKAMSRPKSGDYYELPKLIEKLSSKGLRTRLSCVMLKNYVDSVEEAKNLMSFAKKHGVHQLTLRRADVPHDSMDKEIARFITENRIDFDSDAYKDLARYLEKNGALCDTLPHGAGVYEIKPYKQNVCISTGLTNYAGEKEIRQLIFFPEGILTTSWENIHGGRIL